MENFDKIWCFHFTLCVRDNFRIGRKYQLPRLIYTNDYCFVVLLDVLGVLPLAYVVFICFCNGFFPFVSREKKIEHKNESKKKNTKMKKNQGHTCVACKKRENEKKENLQACQQCSLMKHKKIMWMFQKTQALET
jgi:hypothetical protein